MTALKLFSAKYDVENGRMNALVASCNRGNSVIVDYASRSEFHPHGGSVLGPQYYGGDPQAPSVVQR